MVTGYRKGSVRLTHPDVRTRAKPGARGKGEFYHIEVRPKTEFQTFRTQDVGKKGGIERVAGKRAGGSWGTQKWLIGKERNIKKAHTARAASSRS